MQLFSGKVILPIHLFKKVCFRENIFCHIKTKQGEIKHIKAPKISLNLNILRIIVRNLRKIKLIFNLKSQIASKLILKVESILILISIAINGFFFKFDFFY